MTRDEGVALIKQQLNFNTALDGGIVTLMQLAQTTLERGPTKPWFLESDPTSLVTVADNELVALPSGFIHEMEEQPLIYIDSDGKQHYLYKDHYDQLKRNFRLTDNDEPKAYALLKDNIAIFPTPDAIYNLSWRFYEADVVLDTNVENNWLREVPLLLLGSAGQMIAGGPVRDKAALEIFKDWIATGLAIVHRHDSKRSEAGSSPQMGGAHN